MRTIALLLALIPSMAFAQAKPATIFLIGNTGISAAKDDISKGVPGSLLQEFKTGEEALSAMTTWTPSVAVICTISNPGGKDRWDTLREIQKKYPLIPVICVSPAETEKALDQIRAARANPPLAVIKSPVKRGELSSAVLLALRE